MIDKKTLLKFLDIKNKKWTGKCLSLKMWIKIILLAMELKEKGLKSENIKI